MEEMDELRRLALKHNYIVMYKRQMLTRDEMLSVKLGMRKIARCAKALLNRPEVKEHTPAVHYKKMHNMYLGILNHYPIIEEHNSKNFRREPTRSVFMEAINRAYEFAVYCKHNVYVGKKQKYDPDKFKTCTLEGDV